MSIKSTKKLKILEKVPIRNSESVKEIDSHGAVKQSKKLMKGGEHNENKWKYTD
jgi:hypothetical protein